MSKKETQHRKEKKRKKYASIKSAVFSSTAIPEARGEDQTSRINRATKVINRPIRSRASKCVSVITFSRYLLLDFFFLQFLKNVKHNNLVCVCEREREKYQLKPDKIGANGQAVVIWV